VEALDGLREQLVQLDARPPLYLRFGLYSGNDVAPYLRTIYFDAVEERFKKPTVAALEGDLRNFVAGTPTASTPNAGTSSAVPATPTEEDVLGRHYDLLKAYLMLAEAARVEPTFLASTISDYWKRTAPPDTEILSLQELDFYARQLVRDDAPHIKVDARLVSDARRKLAAYPPVNRFYKRIVTEINAKASPVSIDSVLEGRGRGSLVGTYTVPGSYTIDAYRNFMKSAIENAGEEISKDDWVMGTAAGTASAQSTDISNLKTLYLLDYTDQWRKFLRGISVRPFKTKDDAVETLWAL
jgi:type VI secretion system protein ImpL